VTSLADRIPPHDEDAEKSVLGSILIAWDDGLDRAMAAGITVDSFFVPGHRLIFAACVRASLSGRPLDQQAVAQALKAEGHLEQCGGSIYLDRLIDATPTAAHLEHYAATVQDKALARAIIAAAREAEAAAMEPGAEIEAVRSRAEFALATLAARSPGLAKRTNAEVLSTQVATWRKAREHGNVGLPAGFSFWRNSFGGFAECGFYIVSGKPGCAKTTLCRNLVEHLSLVAGIKTAVSSLEQTAEQFLGAMAARESNQNLFGLNCGYKNADLAALIAAVPAVAGAPLIVQDRPQTLPEFCSWCRRMVGHEKARLICLDYAQRLKPDQKYGSEEARYADYSVTLVNLAKELRVPLLVVARESENGGLYGARQWEYDALGWVRMKREETCRPGGAPTFTASVEKNRFGPLVTETLEMVTDGGYLRPICEETPERKGGTDDDGLDAEEYHPGE